MVSNWYLHEKTLSRLLYRKQQHFQRNSNVIPDINKEFHQGFRARIAALRPNGPISTRFLSNNPAVLVIGGAVFVHGGLLQEHVSYGLEQINKEVRDWINGLKGSSPPDIVWDKNSLLSLRIFSSKKCDCSTLQHVLDTIPGAERMIMGHTIQRRINGACDNRAIRIDVGMSKGCGNGFAEVLEIVGNSEIGVYSARPVPLPVRRKDESKVMLIPENRQVEA